MQPYKAPEITGMTKESDINSTEIEEKFVRFAYRYKFEDNEYSVISPFSDIAFVPNDDIIILQMRHMLLLLLK